MTQFVVKLEFKVPVRTDVELQRKALVMKDFGKRFGTYVAGENFG